MKTNMKIFTVLMLALTTMPCFDAFCESVDIQTCKTPARYNDCLTTKFTNDTSFNNGSFTCAAGQSRKECFEANSSWKDCRDFNTVIELHCRRYTANSQTQSTQRSQSQSVNQKNQEAQQYTTKTDNNDSSVIVATAQENKLTNITNSAPVVAEETTKTIKASTATTSPVAVNTDNIKIQKPKELSKEDIEKQNNEKKKEEKETCDGNSLAEWKDDKCICKESDQEWDGFECVCKDSEKVIENGKCVKEEVDKAVAEKATEDFNKHVASLKNAFEAAVQKYKSECDSKHGTIKDGVCQEPEKNNQGNK